MKKIMIYIFSFCMAMGLFAITAQAEVLQEGDFSYEILEDGTAEITEYTGNETELIVPKTLGNYQVTMINLRRALCPHVTRVSIHENIAYISLAIYLTDSNLEYIEVSESNKDYCSVDGVLFNKSKTTLITYPPKKVGEYYTVPKGVTTIDFYAFQKCHALKSVIISEGVSEILFKAFFDCTNLENIVLPNSLKNIDDSAFGFCENLKVLNIPNGVQELGGGAFLNCTSLKTATIPESVIMAEELFYGCTNLEYIEVSENNNVYCSVDGVLFSKDKSSLITYPAGKKDIFYKIPDGVRDIVYSAFASCDNLINVEIPNSMTELMFELFCECDNLKTACIPDSITLIKSAAFSSSLEGIFYLGTKEQWEAIEIAEYNSAIDRVPIYYNATYPGKFNDISVFDWFYGDVGCTYESGFMTGMNEQYFEPSSLLARGQFASILHRMNHEPQVAYTGDFPDVKEGIWYTAPILWAKQAGIISGYANKNFGPADYITREQIAIMMYNYANYLGYDTSIKGDISKFPDAEQVSWYAKDAMQWAVGRGLILGKDNGARLDPHGNTSRAECAAIIQRFI